MLIVAFNSSTWCLILPYSQSVRGWLVYGTRPLEPYSNVVSPHPPLLCSQHVVTAALCLLLMYPYRRQEADHDPEADRRDKHPRHRGGEHVQE